MGSTWGNAIKISIFGESHGTGIGVVIDGFPSGVDYDEAFVLREMERRAPGRNKQSTQRREADLPAIQSGIYNGKTTGTPICALIQNTNQRSGDYAELAVQPRPADVGALTEAAVQAAQPEAGRRGVQLTSLPAEASAYFDPKWTQEALGNLIDNAIKYTPAGGSVTVSVTPYELFCRIDVADTGPGIPEDEQARIFERFYRSPTVRDEQGVGLGLYLAREIAAANGGYIKVTSRLGKGSTFSLFLPRGQ